MEEEREELSKRYYRIGEVADMIGIPVSTLRYWEQEFSILRPQRGGRGRRLYRAGDVERVKMIHYLVKIKGLKIEAAKQQQNNNPAGVARYAAAVDRLMNIRSELVQMLEAINRLR